MLVKPMLLPAMFSLLVMTSVAASAQNSTQSPPAAAEKEGGVEGDPNGAIRSLGGTSASNYEPGHQKVTIPQFDTHTGGPSRTGGVPEGTTGPDARLTRLR